MAKKTKNKRRIAQTTQVAVRAVKPSAATSAATKRVSLPVELPAHFWWIGIASLTALSLWAYWPTLVWMEDRWRNEPDYSHGYLIVPLAIALLYFRRDSFPANSIQLGWGGIGLLIVAIALRVGGRLAYMDFLDGWTLVPWVAGMVWLFGGRRLLFWAWPAVVFLVLLTPMPYQAESLLSFKLQGVATSLSTIVLQTLGFAAIPDGNTIWLGEQQLMVAEACSGLRILMGMVAMGFFFTVLSDRCWADRVVIIVCCIPIAIAVNVLRVIGTGMAFYWLDERWAHLIHDLLGVFMVMAGAAMFLAVKSFWEHLYRPLEVTMLQKRLVTQ